MPVKVITALDFNDIRPVKTLVNILGSSMEYYKVGLELFVSAGYPVLEYLKNEGKKVFLDLKFHDIPNTASHAVSAAADFGADIIDIHTQGGSDMMSACAESLKEACDKKGVQRPLLIGVTLLTSLDETHLHDFGIADHDPLSYVLLLAEAAKAAGLDGTVSSAKESEAIKNTLGHDFITVTPGIRPAGTNIGDQKRVVTPADAKAIGTDYIVVGRPITAAADPLLAALNILGELK